MMKPSLDILNHHSGIITAPADRSIGDCVRTMRTHKIGSLIVVSDLATIRLEAVGIFTERDLLVHIDQIQHGGFWDKPIRTVMTAPLITLPLSRFEEAGQIMLSHRIRHLPVIADGDQSHLIAVLSMRDLFEDLQKAGQIPPVKAEPRPIRRIAYFGQDSVWLNYLHVLFRKDHGVEVLLSAEPETARLLVIDWDTAGVDIRQQFIRGAFAQVVGIPQPVFILYSPGVLPEEDRTQFEILSRKSNLHFFTKPVATFSFYSQLKSALAERS